MDLVTLKNMVSVDGFNSNRLREIGINLKEKEFKDLYFFLENIYLAENFEFKKFVEKSGAFKFGYRIPQISREFDLLRIGKNYVLNIEIKNGSTPEKQKKQIEKNKYYLKALNKKIIIVSVDLKNKSNLMMIHDESNDTPFLEVSYDEIYNSIIQQDFHENIEYDKCFNPKKYLVSPFNDTEKFWKGNYFLTNHQQEIKENFYRHMYCAIEGRAGTGKSLLLYDIVKNMNKKDINIFENILIIHAGTLNEGHYKLKAKGLNIIEIKDVKLVKLDSIKYILIDEAQRMFTCQFNYLCKKCLEKNISLSFFYDSLQDFEKSDPGKRRKKGIEEFIENNDGFKVELTDNIRSNSEISTFINQIFLYKPNRINVTDNRNNIKLHYLKSEDELSEFLSYYNQKKYHTLGYTPSKYDEDDYDRYSQYDLEIPHYILGQEFDKVLVIIDNTFEYRENGKGDRYLASKSEGSYYSGKKMLFQNLTRVKEKLAVLVYDNFEVFNVLAEFIDKT